MTPAAHPGGPERRHHGNRHGRSEEARLAVLEAADDLLVEKGFAGVTMEGIASRAGVAKQTIYRWWSTKADVLMDAFLQDATEDLTPPDTGDFPADLRAYLHRLAWFLAESQPGAVFRSLLAQAQHDPVFAEEFRARCLTAQRHRDRALLERAVTAGRLPSSLDLDTETDQLVGPLYYRVLISPGPIPERFTNALTDAFLQRHAAQDLSGRSSS
ncbi:TetR/AcrR family transcriptional regulator [Streptomyces sp. uw30]|uniref:TetR/AcrR family transcriptional regulator n=1 Tax=Streptomyces sp. uw30 TaxID=1828179 RepID=UPI0011CDB267|nr:TetR/AcrR family transcriptional regulator [Streptomyces sp. uw30]TXS45036.1 TetR/AcrR family transcriptional regulator [Streptomyces sp. uw30]